jgi:D-alanine-D-alanine ligase
MADSMKIAVLYGGTSAERPVSLDSGRNVIEALERKGHEVTPVDIGDRPIGQLASLQVDLAFIVLHGRGGEDGVIQAVLETLGIPYAGSGVMASALAMDKYRCKLIWKGAGLPTPDAVFVTRDDGVPVIDRFPVFVKPVREGSSIGMNRVDAPEDLAAALENAFQYDEGVLVEQFVDGEEYTCSIIEGRALPMIMLNTANTFYDYNAKYQANDTEYRIPCGLPDDVEQAAQRICEQAYALVGCKGWGRVDLMRDRSGCFWLLEVNTIPGMTSHSLLPKAARAAGIEFDDLVERLARQALSR